MAKILVVEDDELLAGGLAFALTKEGFVVKPVGTLKEARSALAEEGPFDLLLLDVMLPDGQGFDLCKEVRARSQSPVLFLTACDDEESIIRGLDLGGDDYIAKPFRVKELIYRIRANLRRVELTPLEEHRIVRTGPFRWDTLAGKVEKSERELSLTPVEYQLFTQFLRHPGQTLTRSQLLDRLWDEHGEFVDDNTLSVHIRRLREKVENDPSSPSTIVTIRGIGYRMEQEGHPHA